MINWKLRLKNKTTLLALLAALVALVYQILAICGVTPAVTKDSVIGVIGIAVNALCLLGIVVDPTTSGVSDSERALNYDVPRKDNTEDA